MEIHLNKRLLVHVSLKEEARNIATPRHGGFMLCGFAVEVNPAYDHRPYFTFSVSSTSDELPTVVANLVDNIGYSESSYGAKNKWPDQGVYKHGSAIATVASSSGYLEISIVAKDLRSLVEIYARVFPEDVLQEVPLA